MIERREYDSEDGIYRNYYYPVVQCTALDGKTRNVEMTEGSDIQAYNIGEEVTVLYEPEHPLDMRIKSLNSNILMWMLPGITGILGIAFGGSAFLVKKLMSD